MEPTSHSLDPRYPWIKDPAELPSNLNWGHSLLNPFGETTRLHFTRVWTALFFARLIVFVVPIALTVLFSATGGKLGFDMIPIWGFPLILVLTAIGSFTLHTRRLANAKRSGLWALLPILPLLIGLFGFLSGLQLGSMEYRVAVAAGELREEGIHHKAIAVQLQRPGVIDTLSKEVVLSLAERRVSEGNSPRQAVSLAREDASINRTVDELLLRGRYQLSEQQSLALRQRLGGLIAGSKSEKRGSKFLRLRQGHRLSDYRSRLDRTWNTHLPNIEFEEISERTHAIRSGVGALISLWALPSFLVTLWSLLWVGRLPNGGGSIESRMEEMRAHSQV